MKRCHFGNNGFFSLSVYVVLIYLIGLYYQYYNEIMITIDIRMNFIEIYQEKIRGILEQEKTNDSDWLHGQR